MLLLVNDLSFSGQFNNITEFRVAIEALMKIRRIARQYGRPLRCHRDLTQTRVTQQMVLRQAIQHFTPNERQAFMQWLTREGPFWDDNRQHGPDDYLEHNGIIVTDTALGEAAFQRFQEVNCSVASLCPSEWLHPQILVAWVKSDDSRVNVDVDNYWDASSLEDILRTIPAPVQSWSQLATICQERHPQLTFGPDCFRPLKNQPFVHSVAEQIIQLLDVLARFKGCFNADGDRTEEGLTLQQTYFAGGKARFSDSSETEKNDFKKELKFPHPARPGENLSCTWHGKIKTPQYRIHFSWPVRAVEPLYVMYIGPKITKR